MKPKGILFFVVLGVSINIYAHRGFPFLFYIVDNIPVIEEYFSFANIDPRDIESIDVASSEYSMSKYICVFDSVQNKYKYSADTISAFKNQLSQIYYKNDGASTYQSFRPLLYIDNKYITHDSLGLYLNQIYQAEFFSFAVINNCKDLKQHLKMDSSNGIIMIYTKNFIESIRKKKYRIFK